MIPKQIYTSFNQISDWAFILKLDSQTFEENKGFFLSEYEEYKKAKKENNKIQIIDGLVDTYWTAARMMQSLRMNVRERVLERQYCKKILNNPLERFLDKTNQESFANLAFFIFDQAELLVKNYSFGAVFNPVLISNNTKYYHEFLHEIPVGTYQVPSVFKGKTIYHLRRQSDNKVVKPPTFVEPDFSHLIF